MGIDSLKTILSPPVDPQEVALTDDWEAIEKQLSTPLPKDYKAFVRAYGTGTINHFIVVYNPFSRNKFVRLVERGQRLLQSLATLISDFPEYYPHVVYPAQVVSSRLQVPITAMYSIGKLSELQEVDR